MIVVTGAAGFIGSVLSGVLNENGFTNLLLVDDFQRLDKVRNFEHKKFEHKIHRNDFIAWFKNNSSSVEFVFHIGARTDTTEFNHEIFDELNLNYTKSIWTICSENRIPMIYASSAATYGAGEFGYDDNHAIIPNLIPLNPYGESKNNFDIWAISQEKTPPFWAGLKFFNVYGPNEFHKGRMASVIMHAFKQINETGGMKLFRSHKEGYNDGEQLRDFIYVKDLVNVLLFLMKTKPNSGIYNLGTGKARSFLDLAKATFKAMQKPENIEFVDTPIDIRDKYQYYTQANMQKLLDAGYNEGFRSLEEGVSDYVCHYLLTNMVV